MMMKNKLPIGIFDSGLGGLTVVKQIMKLLPYEDIIYLGDTARVPYGTRSKETITKFSFEDANFLIGKNVKCIVIACNTSSALAGKELKSKLNIPVFDVISPALKYARSIAKQGNIGVIGTRGTVGSGAYMVDYSTSCPLFVPFIEEGDVNSEALKIIVKKYLSYFKGKGINTLIMGCTHYPIIQSLIQKEIGKNIKLIDPGRTVAEELKYSLVKNELLNKEKRYGKVDYFVTDLTDRFTKVAEMFLGKKIKGRINKVSVD